MFRKTLILSFFVCWAYASGAQSKPGLLYFVKTAGSADTLISRHVVINPDNLEQVSLISREKIAKLAGSDNVNGVVFLGLKPGARLMDRSETLKTYRIPRRFRHLPISIDQDKPEASADLLVEQDGVISVSVDREAKVIRIQSKLGGYRAPEGIYIR